MANYVTTLKDDSKTNGLLPRTVLKAVADDNGNYLDNQLLASDLNALKNGKIADMTQDIQDNSDAITSLITGGSGCLKFKVGSDTYAICWGTYNAGNMTGSALNSWYYYSKSVSIPFGITFETSPICIGNIQSNNLSYVQTVDASTTAIYSFGFGSPQYSVDNVRLIWLAIGKVAST